MSMTRQKSCRGFTYHYDLGSVKVSRPISRSVGKSARLWLEYLGLSQMQLILIGRETHDPLSSGSVSVLFKGAEMVPPGDLKRIADRDFDCICVIIENNAEGKLFKQKDRLARVILRELVHVARPETRSDPESCANMVEAIIARAGR